MATLPVSPVPEPNPVIREDLAVIANADLPWPLLRDKTIMISGGAGFLASYLVKALLWVGRAQALNLKLICIVRNPANAGRLDRLTGLPEVNLFHHDITHPLPADFPRADLIVHAASQASPRHYGSDPVGTLRANITGTAQLLDHAVSCGCERFLFFSSGEVYGVPVAPSCAVSETDYGYLDPMQVRSCYAESKRMGETMCAAWSHQHGLHTSVVRPFHTYGPGMALDDGRVFADFVADVAAGRDITLKSDGLTLRPFCYLSDATIAFLRVLLCGDKAVAYNVGNPNAEISIRDLATLLAGLFPERGLQPRFEVDIKRSDYLPSPVTRSCPDIERIRGLGWQPKVGLEEGFRRTIASFS